LSPVEKTKEKQLTTDDALILALSVLWPKFPAASRKFMQRYGVRKCLHRSQDDCQIISVIIHASRAGDSWRTPLNSCVAYPALTLFPEDRIDSGISTHYIRSTPYMATDLSPSTIDRWSARNTDLIWGCMPPAAFTPRLDAVPDALPADRCCDMPPALVPSPDLTKMASPRRR